VLLVEDDDGLAWPLSRFVASRGYAVVRAARAAEAAEILRARPIDCALVDVHLPDRDGVDLAREIRERNPNVDVVVVTSDDAVDVIARAISAGAIDYLV
jgi:two-component system response regulator HydG